MTGQDWVNLILGLAAILAGGTGAAAHYRLNGHLGTSSFWAHPSPSRPGPGGASAPSPGPDHLS